jgi:hypothetical protein
MLTSPVLDLILFLLGQAPADTESSKLLARANVARDKASQLKRDANKEGSIARTERQTVKERTGIETDINPYIGVDDFGRLLACIVAATAQRTQPELLLALWMKEARLQVFTEVKLDGARAVTNSSEAKSMFIAMNFFKFLGADMFTRYVDPAKGDNSLLEEGRFASEHAAVLDRASEDLRTLGVAREDYVKAMRDNLSVTGGTGGAPFTVRAQGQFYPAMLSMTHALFEKIRTVRDPLYDEFSLNYPLSSQLAYVIFNGGRGAKSITDKGGYSFLKNEIPRAAAKGMTLDDFILNTKVVGKPWFENRRNLVRFNFYLKCFAPIFA